MKKTLILSIDLLFAIFLLAAFVIIVSNVRTEDSFQNKLLYTYAKNTLLFMDDSLATKREFVMHRDIDTYLPDNIEYQMRVDYYKNGAVVKSTTFGSTLLSEYVVVSRPFIYEDEFGYANIRVWVGERRGVNGSGANLKFHLYPIPAWYIDKQGNVMDAVPLLMEDDGIYVGLRGENPLADEYLVNLTYETPYTYVSSVKVVSKYYMPENSDPIGGNTTLYVWNNGSYVFYTDTELNSTCLTEILGSWIIDTCDITSYITDPSYILIEYYMKHTQAPRLYERRVDYIWLEMEGGI